MIEILVATNRLKSNSERLAHLVQKKLSKKKSRVSNYDFGHCELG